MKILEFLKDANGQFSSTRLFSLLITLTAIFDWMHVLFWGNGIWNPEPQTIGLVLGVLGFRFVQKFGEEKKGEASGAVETEADNVSVNTEMTHEVEQVKYQIKKTRWKIWEFLEESNGQFSSSRLFSMLVTISIIIDWIYSIYKNSDKTWHPEVQTIVMVLGVLGFKSLQKFQEAKLAQIKKPVEDIIKKVKG